VELFPYVVTLARRLEVGYTYLNNHRLIS